MKLANRGITELSTTIPTDILRH